MMSDETRARFIELWEQEPKIPLADIAKMLGYSFASLAKYRMLYGLRKRYGADDEPIPTPEVIRIRAQAQQTNWSPAERRLRWRGTPHTIYASIQGYDGEPQT